MQDSLLEAQCAELLDQHGKLTDGFACPDWEKLYQWAEQSLPPERIENFYETIVPQWLERLRRNLGEDYKIAQSDWFLLLSPAGEEENRQILDLAGRCIKVIFSLLGRIAASDSYGSFVVLLLREPDDYRRYFSLFYPEGDEPTAKGFLIPSGYSHIVLAQQPVAKLEPLLFHLLIYQCLIDQDLPRWLTEGLGLYAQSTAGYSHFYMNEEVAQGHWELWDETNIQQFWSGTAFNQGNTAPYELAAILVRLILSDLNPSREDFADFALNAEPADAGDASARQYLDADLGSVASIFLGEGNWTPKPEQWT